MSDQYCVRFLTRDEAYSVADHEYQLPGTSTSNELNTLINKLLEQDRSKNDNAAHTGDEIEFAFVVNGEMIQTTLLQHLEERDRSAEQTIEIEYFPLAKPPTAFKTILHQDWVSCLHSGSRHLLSGCFDGTVHLWSLNDGQHLLCIPAHKTPVKAVRWVDTSMIGDSLSSLAANSLSVNAANDNPSNQKLKKSKPDLLYFVTASFDETIVLWAWNANSTRVEKLHVLKGHIRSVDCVDVHHDVLVSGSYDKLIKLWMINDSKTILDSAIGSSADDQTGDEADVAPIKRKKTQKPLIKNPYTTLAGHCEAIADVCWMDGESTDEQSTLPDLASCSMDNTIRIWDMELFTAKQTLKGSKAFLSMNYSPINKLLITGSCDNFVRLFDPRASEGSIVKAGYSSHSGWVSSVAWQSTVEGNGNSQHFISGSFDQTVKHWDVRCTKGPLYDLVGHKERVTAVDWSNASYMISGSTDGTSKIFKAGF